MIEAKLTGISLAARHKSLNGVISSAKAEDFTPEFTSKLSTGSQLDQVYLAEVANKLENKSVICELLKSEDRLILSKALKCKWFFKKSNNPEIINVKYFNENFFPNVSYMTKCKLLANLNLYIDDHPTAEDFYRALLQSHSRDFAVKMLPACSEAFISDELMVPDPDISEAQIKLIYRKYPQMMITYMQKYLDTRNRNDYLLGLIAMDYPDTFIQMYDNHYDYVAIEKFSYRMSVYLLKNHLDFVMKHATRFSEKLDVEAVLKVLKGDSRDNFLLEFVGEDMDAYPYILNRYLSTMKKDYAALYMIQLYEKKYNKSPLTERNYISSVIMDLPLEMRSIYVKNQMIKDNDEKKYVKYLSVTEGIDRLKFFCQTTSTMYDRIQFLENMIDCCKINKDETALLEVMRYVAKRHRNDAEQLRYQFLTHLQDQYTLHKLSSEHWEVIDEMLTIMYFNKDIEKNYRQYFLGNVLEEKIHFNLINDLEIESTIDIMFEYCLNQYNIIQEVPEYELKVLDIIFDRFKPQIVGMPFDTNIVRKIEVLLQTYESWNSRHPKNVRTVTGCDWLMDVLRKWLVTSENEENPNSNILQMIWNDLEARKIFIDDLFKVHCNSKVIKYALIHNIDTVLNNIDWVLKKSASEPYSFHTYRYIYYRIRAYLNKPLSDKLKEMLFEKIEKPDENPESLGRFLSLLSFLIKTEDFEVLLKKHTLDLTKIKFEESSTNISKEEYQKTMTVVNSFKFVNPSLSYNTILNYCKGDYLKLSLSSLLSASFKKNYKDTNDYLISLSGKCTPVSLKKHSLRLLYFLYPRDELISVYRKIWDEEKNNSIREVLFQRTFNLFNSNKKNDSMKDSVWETLKHYYNSFTEEDTNLFMYLTFIDKIPKSIFAEFSKVSWMILKKLSTEQKLEVNEEMAKLIYGISNRIEELDESFCEVIINEYLSSVNHSKDQTSKARLSEALLGFCVAYLTRVKSEEAQKKRTAEICLIFKTYILKYWNNKGLNEPIKETLHSFLSGCCSYYFFYKDDLSPIPVLTSLTNMLSIIPFETIFQINLHLKLTLMLIESKQDVKDYRIAELEKKTEVLERFAKSLLDYLKILNDKYGCEAHDLYKPVVKSFIMDMDFVIVSREFGNLHLLKMLLTMAPTSKSILHLVVDLLPMSINKIAKPMFDEIIEMIVSSGDITINMILDEKVKIPSATFGNVNPE